MLITRTNPVGIDAPIQSVQTDLHNALLTEWGIDTALYECYGRCYRKKIDGGYVAENYDGNNEYKEVYWNDSLAAISFFGTGGRIDEKQYQEADVHLVFFVDLKKIKPSITHRADEEVRQDIYQAINRGSYGLTFTGFEFYTENCLREYPGSRRENRLKAVDMHPVHCIRLNFSMNYDILQNCTPLKNF